MSSGRSYACSCNALGDIGSATRRPEGVFCSGGFCPITSGEVMFRGRSVPGRFVLHSENTLIPFGFAMSYKVFYLLTALEKILKHFYWRYNYETSSFQYEWRRHNFKGN